MTLPPVETGYPMPLSEVEIGKLTAQIPSLLVDCFDYVLTEGLIQGVFRISGSVRRMKQTSADYSSYKSWLCNEKRPAPHDVCGIIKKYLRDYLQQMNGLFPSLVLTQLLSLYHSHLRSDSHSSLDSYKSANTSFDTLSLFSAIKEELEIKDGDALLDSVAHFLVTKNTSSRNSLFFFLLWKLTELAKHEDVTKMTVANLLIIFQPYIFNTSLLTDLKPFQDFLTYLVENFDSLLEKYVCYKSIIGGLEELDTDIASILSSESVSASPVTVYSNDYSSPTRRKSSLSNRLSVLFDNYALPANRSKRFSLSLGSSRLNVEKSTENLRAVCPHDASKSTESVDRNVNTPNEKEASVHLQRPAVERKHSNRRKSIIGLFKSAPSFKSNDDLTSFSSHSPLASPMTIPEKDAYFPKQPLNDSVDNLISPKELVVQQERRKLIRHSFSLRSKKKV